MRLLRVHPRAVMYSEIFLRRADLMAAQIGFRPHAPGISVNCLANVPEAIEISEAAKQAVPGRLVFACGRSISFIADGHHRRVRSELPMAQPLTGGRRQLCVHAPPRSRARAEVAAGTPCPPPR